MTNINSEKIQKFLDAFAEMATIESRLSPLRVRVQFH